LKRKYIRDVPVQRVGAYAVFRHNTEMRRAHFTALHENYETAREEAVRLTLEMATKEPSRQHVYYVVRIEAMFQGGKDGFLCEP